MSYVKSPRGRPTYFAPAVNLGATNKGGPMLLIIGCVLLVLWLLGFVLLKKTVGAIIHVLLIIAIIAIAIHFLGGRATP